MTSAKIIQLGGLDDSDDEYIAFLDSLKEDAVRAVYIVEKKDGTVSVGTNSTDTRDVLLDFFRLQQFCQTLVNGNTSYGDED
jgi:hypothetical protein